MQLRKVVEKVVAECGLELYDLDEPAAGPGGVVRVYLNNPDKENPSKENPDKGHSGKNGVGFEECAKVARELLDIDELHPFIPDGCLLEVSSPGINRRLRLPQHFVGAVGERAKIKYSLGPAGEPKGTATVLGVVIDCDGKSLNVRDEKSDSIISIEIEAVKNAHLDFPFSNKSVE